jgi:hypothetical protein
MFTARFEEFGLSRAHGTFCSMDAVQRAAAVPALVPRKHPLRPESTKSNAVKGCLGIAVLVFILAVVVIGSAVMLRSIV